jgi:hypothetical protein
MSNVKQVLIRGSLPFNITENDEAAKWLGRISAPSIGLRIRYGATHLVPLDSGGQLTMYDFTIAGTEAWSFKALDKLVEVFESAGATIDVNEIVDIEDFA